MTKENLRYLALLGFVWLAAIALVNPKGDFPLNDDFSYGRTVLNLLESGELVYDEWYATSLFTQVILGSLFCKIFGFSFTILRLFTLLLAYLAAVATYFLCLEIKASRKTAFFATLLTLFNPLFFSLSFSFMTDVPYYAFSSFAMIFYLKALLGKGTKWIILGSIFAIAGIFIRQIGLMLPLAFGLAWLFKSGARPKEVLRATLPLLVAFLLFFLYSKWLAVSQTSIPESYGDFHRLLKWLKWDRIKAMPLRLGVILAYLGLFLLPLTCLFLRRSDLAFCGKKNAVNWLLLLVVVLAGCLSWHKMPWGNMIYNFGIGPKLLKDGGFFQNIRPVAPDWLIASLKIIGLTGAVALLILTKKQVKNQFAAASNFPPALVFALANIVLYMGYLFLDLHCFDRYFFQLIPFLLVCLLPMQAMLSKAKTISLVLASIILLAMATVSIGTTHDYLAWNRARWSALDDLTKNKGISPNLIDGGLEFNGWHRPGPIYNDPYKSWWWVDKDEYVVAFGDIKGFKKIKGFAYQQWLPPAIDSVFVLKHD